jgi:allantoicase
MTDFTTLVDLASERLGGRAIAANDDFFAPKENLVKASRPIWIEDKYTDRGKWMDGWETRRRREPGFDWAIVRLGLPGAIHGFVVDTAFFTGNYPESCSIEACEAMDNGVESMAAGAWFEVLPRSPLQGGAANRFVSAAPERRATHLRLNIFPDGGVARLRAYGRVLADWTRLRAQDGPIDLAAIEHGGLVVASSDSYFGNAQNMLMPGESHGMHDGWETRRRRGPGHDWAIVELGAPGSVERLVVDTTHYKGNAPGSCSVDWCHAPGADAQALLRAGWRPLLTQTPLQPHTRHEFEALAADVATHVRLNIFPDGGVGRFRAFGRPGNGA